MLGNGIPYWRLSGFYFFYFAVVGTLSPYLGLYLQHIHFDAMEIGMITAALLISRVIAPNVWGWLSDRSGRRLALIRLGALSASLIFTATFWFDSFWSLLLIVSLFSFFWNAILAPFEVVTLGHLQGRAHFYSRIRLWGSVGFIVAVSGLGWVFDHNGMGYFPLAVWGLLILIWGMTCTVQAQDTDIHHHHPGESFRDYAWRKPVLCFLISGVLLQFSFGSYYTFFSVYLEMLGYSHITIGTLWSLGVAAEIVLFMVAHQLIGRFGLRPLMLFTLGVTALRWWLIGCYAELFWLMVLVQLLHAFSFGAAHAVSIEWIRRAFPASVHGQGQALYSSMCFGLGGGLGALVSGWLWEASPVAVFAISAVSAALAMTFVWLGMNGRDGIKELPARS